MTKENFLQVKMRMLIVIMLLVKVLLERMSLIALVLSVKILVEKMILIIAV